VIRGALQGGLSIPDLYLTIFQPVQYELGRLWLFNKISGAEEHYCTAATQALMLELYPDIISSPRSGMTLVAACAGPELHEIGIRMVADFFEMDGWDTWYLGAAVSVDLLLSSIEHRKPNLVALSVTMSSHIGQVRELIKAIKGTFTVTTPPIMVGGLLFNTVPDLWRIVGADLWAINAEQAVLEARELLASINPE
jgi:MerR family transcriptional regulator, light-induced transcriptional regulator